jgi:tetratricopeptide (TPR) repeat protein
MECDRKMDPACRTAAARTAVRTRFSSFVFILLLFTFSGAALAQDSDSSWKQLADAEQWQEIVRQAETEPPGSADMDFYYGSALAHLERWDDAKKAFVTGQALQPTDVRFPEELAGVAFKQKRYDDAVKHLHRALQLKPDDEYADDFLGTIYFLQGNLDAALKYWNRVKKPRVEKIAYDPPPKLDATLLDHSFAFSQASTLQLQELRDTADRLRNLGIFPDFRFELVARPDGDFNVIFRNHERNGYGSNKWVALFMLLRGLPAQTVFPEYFNINHEALNFTSVYRFDAQKRRVQANLSGPLAKNPKRGFGVGVDLREENWALQSSFTGPTDFLGGLNLRREALYGKFAALPGEKLHWSGLVELSHRDFRGVVDGPALTPSLLSKGYQLKEQVDVSSALWQDPERHMRLDGSASSQTGRLWSAAGETFEKLQGTAQYHWLPRSTSDDYAVQARASAGKVFGDVPFDELWMLGIGGDNDLWMRGHIATRDGKKGSGPLGRDYFVSNFEVDKNVYQLQMVRLILSPFVDTGAIRDDLAGLGSHKWLTDVGASLKLKALGFGVALSYGKDLRSGNNAFYATLLR